jgi:hypothetical protein
LIFKYSKIFINHFSAAASRDQGRLALAAAAISSSSPSSAAAPFEFRVTSTSGREIQDASAVQPREAPRVKREQFVPLELAQEKVRVIFSGIFQRRRGGSNSALDFAWSTINLKPDVVSLSSAFSVKQIAAMQRDAEQARERHQQQLRELDRQHQAVQRETHAHFTGLIEVNLTMPAAFRTER